MSSHGKFCRIGALIQVEPFNVVAEGWQNPTLFVPGRQQTWQARCHTASIGRGAGDKLWAVGDESGLRNNNGGLTDSASTWFIHLVESSVSCVAFCVVLRCTCSGCAERFRFRW